VLKGQHIEEHSTGFMVSSQNFYFIYTNLSTSEKSPFWKVFSSHISVHYMTIIFDGDPTTPHPNIWGIATPRIGAHAHHDHNGYFQDFCIFAE